MSSILPNLAFSLTFGKIERLSMLPNLAFSLTFGEIEAVKRPPVGYAAADQKNLGVLAPKYAGAN